MRLSAINGYLGQLVEDVLVESAVAVGQTVETPSLRIHRYASALKVTDLTNAGKRGKTVDEFALYNLDYVKNQDVQKLVEKFSAQLRTVKNYRSALVMAKGLVAAAERMVGSSFGIPGIETHQYKGVRVRPAGMKEIKIDTPYLTGYADGQRFSVQDKKDRGNEPTIMHKGNRSASQFYKWLAKNEKKINAMDFRDLQMALQKAKINFHYFCAMD